MLGLIGALLKLIFNILLFVYTIIGKVIKLMWKPFKLLWNLIRDFLEDRFSLPYYVDSKFSAFNGFLPFCLFIAALIFAVVNIWVNLGAGNMKFMEELLYNTTFGFFISLINQGQQITPAACVAIAFSGALLPLCMNAHKSEFDRVRWYVRVPCFMVYLVATAVFAILFTDVFQVVGEWGYRTIVDLFNQNDMAFFAVAGRILALIPLCYIALLVCLVAVKNFAECCVFGVLGIVAMIAIGLLLQLVPENLATLRDVLSVVALFGLLFGLDALQGKAVEYFEEQMEDV